MKAVVMQDKKLVVKEMPEPEPGPGEVLVKTLACGVCGSDVHMLHYCDEVLDGFNKAGLPIRFDVGRGVVFGHEYCVQVLDYGPETKKKIKPGTRVCSIPYVITPEKFEHVGYSNGYPGGFGERMILPEDMLVEVPEGLSSRTAALTEPLTVGAHAVGRAGLFGDEVPIVIGCGPIGLAVIIALKGRGIGPVVAADFSEKRRALAEKVGADIVVNPTESTPYQSWVEVAAPEGYDLKGPAALMGIGPQPKPCVVFECVGVPGLIQQILEGTPPRTKVIVVGVCMEPDTFVPFTGIAKEMDMHFSFGYSMEEFAATLHNLAEGKNKAELMISSIVKMDGVAQIFEEFHNADLHVKTLVEFT